MRGFMYPWVNNFDFLWLKGFPFLSSQQGRLIHKLASGCITGGACHILPFTHFTCRHARLFVRYLSIFIRRVLAALVATHNGFIYLVDRELFHLLPKKSKNGG
jgi:hypothetical protein